MHFEPGRNYFQAHRGAVDEAPENTLPAFEHAWSIPGAIPETDVRTSRDGVLLCLHDATLARTTNAPAPLRDQHIGALTAEEVRAWDAGVRFDPAYAGAVAPTLAELFARMADDPGRYLYVEVKDVALGAVRTLADKYGVGDRLLFVSGQPSLLRELRLLFPDAPLMTWLSGTPQEMAARFEAWATRDFGGLRNLQIQFHLPSEDVAGSIVYGLSDELLAQAIEKTAAYDSVVQVRPFLFDAASLAKLMALGIHWYVADAPAAFARALQEGEKLLHG